MTDLARIFIDESRAYLGKTYFSRIERCLESLGDEDVWWRPNEESNSVGNLVLHLDGSTRMWVVGVAGGSPVERDRQQEFDEREHISRAELLERLRRTLAAVDEALARLDAASLVERRQSPWGEMTALEAVYHAVEHFSMHTGQIITLTKMRLGVDLKLSD